MAVLALLGIGVLGAVGLGSLQQDGAQAFALPPDHPVVLASEILDEETAGDDCLVLVIQERVPSPQGLLDPAGVKIIDAVTEAMTAMAAFSEVRSVTTAPILAEVGGVVTAVTPLRPLPATIDEWTGARRQVLSDPFVQGQLISEDGGVAAVVGWLWRGDAEDLLARRAIYALRDEQFRGSPAGVRVQGIVNAARLAVALGVVPPPAQAEIARQLTAAGESEEELAGLVADWGERGDDPALAAAEELQGLAKRLGDGEQAEGLRLGVAGPAVTAHALERLFPPSLLRALLALALLAGMAVFFLRRRVAPALAVAISGPVAFGLSLGLYGFLGFSLNPNTAVLAFLGAWAAVCWGVARSEGGAGKLVALVAWGCPPALAAVVSLGATAGGGAGLVCFLVASLAAAALVSHHSSSVAGLNRRPVPGLVLALALVLAGGGLALRQAPGVDPSRMLAGSEEDGWPARVLGRAMGTVPMGYLVVDARGAADRPFADPETLAILREAQEELQAAEGVRAAVSWSDFVAEIHARVAGVENGALPASRAAVEQYLLLFGRPAETRVLVSTGLDLGLVLVRSLDGQGAKLASLAVPHPPESPGAVLGGDAVVMMVAARSQSIRIALSGGLLLALLALVLPLPAGSPGPLRLLRFAAAAASLSCGLALSSAVEAALTPTALFGALAVAGLVAASWSWNFRAALSTLGVGAASACGLLASPVLALRGLGLVLLAGCVAGWLVRVLVTKDEALP